MTQLKLVLVLLLIVSTKSLAQSRISYYDSAGARGALETDINYHDDTSESGVIVGYGERFNAPASGRILDSIDFAYSSSNPVVISIIVAPCTTVVSNGVRQLLPDLSSAAAKSLSPFSKGASAETVRVSANGIETTDSFFVVMITYPNARLSFPASQTSKVFEMDSSRAVFILQDAKNKKLSAGLIDGNLLGSGILTNLDLGVSFRNSDAVLPKTGTHSTSSTVFPTICPAGGVIHCHGNASISRVTLFDAAGRVVRLWSREGQDLSVIRTDGVSAGSYCAVLTFADRSEQIVKLILY